MPFKKLYVEITNVCNLRCAFCPESGRAPEFMSSTRFRRALESLAALEGHIYLHVLGEPLLHPELDEILDICLAEGRRVNLVTNGRLLGDRAGTLLSAPALRLICVSLHSCAGEGSEAALGLLEDALRVADGRIGERPYVTLRMWRGLKSPEADSIMTAVGRHFPDMTLSPRSGHEAYRLAPGLFLDMAEPFEWPENSGSPIGRGHGEARFCPGLSEQLAVLADGTVVPCCLDARGAISLGNVFEKSIEEILASPRAVAIREGFKARRTVEALCAECGGRP